MALTDKERQMIVNEASLIGFLDSNEIVKCIDIFDFKERFWLVLEYLEGGALTNIIKSQHQTYSEEFCKYALLKTALGLRKMHIKNF